MKIPYRWGRSLSQQRADSIPLQLPCALTVSLPLLSQVRTLAYTRALSVPCPMLDAVNVYQSHMVMESFDAALDPSRRTPQRKGATKVSRVTQTGREGNRSMHADETSALACHRVCGRPVGEINVRGVAALFRVLKSPVRRSHS
jgi:hypothetical protein